ncbi:nucleoside kinase [Pectinatus haikarae]|uniref:Uridine kinase n=1 Tax=Pectinatus haikarae TaxID=349096 RepID=A0ABT9YAN2_9FIRM|nr:nucleoside kinase [Pectinatus haikarae]MDQ0204892.1 uridine kinase [Pectinatus haikarae]
MSAKHINSRIRRIIDSINNNYILPITAVKINNTLKDLQSDIKDYRTLELVDMNCTEGIAIYRRSVLFLLMAALKKIEPNAEVTVEHSMNNGIYCRILPVSLVTDQNIEKLSAKMQEMIDQNLPIVKKSLRKKEAIRFFKNNKQDAKAALIKSLKQDFVSIYCCDDYYDYLYGPMLPETSELKLFAIDCYLSGIVVRTPELSSPCELPPKQNQEKLSALLAEAGNWAGILHCDYVNELNSYIKNQHAGELIRISEALQEKKIAYIADIIAKSTKKRRVIFIAGPSSSGKTTFAQRLRIQLLVNGMRPVSLSMDDYFHDREHTPFTEKGEYDFESFGAIDSDLLNEQILALLAGKGIDVPKYNFITGKKEWPGRRFSLLTDQPIIIEGIHGLNPNLTKSLPEDKIYKIYISALTQLGIDSHNNIPTTVARLIRRIVRDYQFRGSSALKTIKQWPEVRAGEEKNIFPYQENADIMFNSALIYELAVLKKYAYPLLEKISDEVPEYSMSRELLNFLSFFRDIRTEDDIPNNSILREFIGRSCFF